MQYKEASEVLSDLNFEEALIIKGACALAQKNFEAAAGFYARCNTNNLEALYLKAYAEYKNGKYSQSLNDFEKYISVIQNGEKMSEACYFATQSCLYLKDYKRAEKNAELYLESVINQNEKEKAVFLLGDILYDQKKYDKAINLYRQFTKDKSEFSVKCLYKTAICQGISGNIKEASNTYLSVYERFPVSKDADEALFRSGEILYMENMYTEAVKNLKRYYETFPKGAYTDSAMYYEFDSWIKLGDKTKALLLGNKIIMQNPNSSFLNVVLDRIYEINYERGDYDSAYKAAVQLAERTGHKDQGLEKRISYMNRIIQGGNKDQIKAEMEYENAGGKNTLLGREKGTALAKMYSLDSETKYKAFSLAQELLAVQEKDIVNEREYAAINALIMADYFYEQNKKYEASEKYLKAAEYSRMNGDDEKAAFSLYTAAECFMHLGKKGDANETAALLRKLYPESKYSEAVRSLLK